MEDKTVIMVIENKKVVGYVSELKDCKKKAESYWGDPATALRFSLKKAKEIIRSSKKNNQVLVPIDSDFMYLIEKQEDKR